MIRSSVQVRLSALDILKRARGYTLPRSTLAPRLFKPVLMLLLSLLLSLVFDQVRVSEGQPRADSARQWYVALDPGHGGKNYGAIDPREEGRYEKQYTLQIANKVSALLKDAQIKVWQSRYKDEPHSLRSRISKASAAGVDLFVSIHINDAYVVGPRGHGTFFLAREAYEESRLRVREFNTEYRGSLFTHSVKQKVKSQQVKEVLLDLIHQRAQHESMHLAHIMNQALELYSPFGTRGVKQGDYGIIKGITTPAIVCEVGFLNHPKEGPFITSKEGMDALSRGIALGILRYLTLRRRADLMIPESLIPPQK